jgi:uncharacterized membrane protein
MTRADARITSLDAVRGLVMAIMALDHVREFFHADAMVFQAEDLARTTPILFLTRWITHVCAPGFVFLAGLAAARRLSRGGSVAELSRYLATRGLWLVLLEITVMRFALNFRFSPQDPVLLIILVALGLSMVGLAGLVWLPRPAIVAFGAAVVLGHNLLDPLQPADFGAWAPLWNLVHDQGAFRAAGRLVVSGYPVLPWAGLMALGFAAGAIYDLEAAARRRILVRSGLALIATFVVVRAVNGYGDPSPWSVQATPVMTVLSFLRTTKYPPSLQFLLMTIGPVLLLLAWFESRRSALSDALAVIGRVPLFYYVVHFYLIHVAASLLATWQYGPRLAFLSGPFPSMGGSRDAFPPGFGHPLWVTYAAWVGVVVVMCPLCRWFGDYKARHGSWWGSYL